MSVRIKTNIPENGQSVIGFYGQNNAHGFMSQWYKTKFVDGNGIEYTSCEQYMMAQKALLFNDIEMLKAILSTTDPKKIKQYGRDVKNFDIEIWDRNKLDIVIQGNTYKFKQNKDLLTLLLNTGDAYLAECTVYDSIWGVGTYSHDPSQWKGQNLLGIALMFVRDTIKNSL